VHVCMYVCIAPVLTRCVYVSQSAFSDGSTSAGDAVSALFGSIFQRFVPSSALQHGGLGGLAHVLARSGWESLFVHLVGGTPEPPSGGQASHTAVAAPDVSSQALPTVICTAIGPRLTVVHLCGNSGLGLSSSKGFVIPSEFLPKQLRQLSVNCQWVTLHMVAEAANRLRSYRCSRHLEVP
jgi:hypothetical protein